MTIFLTGTIEQTAKDLDPRRLNRQIQECGWLIGMVNNPEKWKNHPCNFMYKDHIDWVILYQKALRAYKQGDEQECKRLSKIGKIYPAEIIVIATEYMVNTQPQRE